MLKKVWFQLHWFFGISAGLVLALMGVTGAALSFQDELLRAFNPASLTVQEQPGGTLALDELVRRSQAVGFKQMIGIISDEMEASIRLHEKHGFSLLGRFPALGYKFDRWVGIVHMQRSL